MIASPHEIAYFIELADTLNFSRASERLGITQPSLTVAIQRLEKSIGVPLFHRNKQGVILTKGGQQLLSHSRQLLHLWDTVKAEALCSSVDVQGCVTLGCHPSVATTTLHHFIPKLLLQYPKLEIKLSHDLSRKTTEKVINHSLDIGIVVNPIKHPDLIIRKLYEDKVMLCHARKMKNPQSILTSENAVIICDPELTQTQQVIKKIQKKGIQFRRMITSSSLEVIAQLTAHGAGFGILPGCVAAAVGEADLMMWDKSPVVHDEICVIYRHESRDLKSIQAVLSALNSIKSKCGQR